MEAYNLYKDISLRTKGEIFLGVVGPVRTGKSTFIRRFMEQLVLPHLEESKKAAARDELPVSGKGKTITTIEPKFVPKEAAEISFDDTTKVKIRLADCVGFVAEGADGTGEEGRARMVKTPWSKEEMPFSKAARIGTEKVIRDHSTAGLLITSDGSFGELPRTVFEEPERRAAEELKKAGKPFLILVNSAKPFGEEALKTTAYLKETYQVSAMTVNCEQLRPEDILEILENLLYEFPLCRIDFYLPRWVDTLEDTHPIRKAMRQELEEIMKPMRRIRDVYKEAVQLSNPYVKETRLEKISLDKGSASVHVELKEACYYEMLSQMTGMKIQSEYQLISLIRELSGKRKSYEKVEKAVEAVRASGYGVITPELSEITLEEPAVIRQGNKYGVRIRAASPSVHMIRAEIVTEIAPIVGSEQQAEDLIRYIEENSRQSEGIWETNIFGKSIRQLVEDGIAGRLSAIGEESRQKLQDTMKRIVNESKGSLICIIL